MELRLLSFAKINLHLQVIGRRGDGYHELRTLFQTVDLADRMSLRLLARPGIELTVRGAELPADASNLAWRAAEAFLAEAAPERGLAITLDKAIPLGGGLGGGSSNAATVLRGLGHLLGQPLSPSRVWEIARGLGADVPYFLVGGSALGTGRGDEVVVLPELPQTSLVLAIPPVAIVTREVFTDLEPPSWPALAPGVAALAGGMVGRLRPADLGSLANDLEPPVLARYREVSAVHHALSAAGAEVVRLSGSGATCWAWFGGRDAPRRLASMLPAGTRVERVKTLSRAARARLELLAQ